MMIAGLSGDNQKAEEISKDKADNRYYRYLPQIVDQLECWYNNEFLDSLRLTLLYLISLQQ